MSKKMKTILIVVALLAAIGVFNWVMQMDPTQLAARGVGQDPHSHGEDEHAHDDQPARPTLEELQEPVGPADAPVTIVSIWNDQQELELALRPMLSSIAGSYDGKVRVEFVGPGSENYEETVEQAGGVRIGLLINGEMIKEIPEADLGMLAFSGSPTLSEWGEPEIRLAIEHELENKGIEFEAHVEHDHSHEQQGRPMPPRPPAGSHAGHGH
jgi:hypothetical protein